MRPPKPKPQLNARQHAAVQHVSSPLLVVAGAGSGKTRVITEKIIFLLREKGLAPEKIAAITFTNKSAREMRERVGKQLDTATAKKLSLSTFHALGWKMLRMHADAAGYRPGISILDEQDSLGIVRDLLPEGAPPEMLKAARWRIGRWKNRAMDPVAARSDNEADPDPAGLALYERYQQHLQQLNAVDFDDLILQPLQLLQQPAVREEWQERIRYVLVDEYQDTNETQYRLLRILAGARGRLTAVGDDDQSIYGWRGAQPENLQQLAHDFPTLEIIKLEQNYRSTRRILSAANAVIKNNPHDIEKRLWSALHEGEKIRVISCATDAEEAQRVAAEIMHRQFTARSPFGDFAVLYRGNHQSRMLEQALREQHIPYHLSGGVSFFNRVEIKDVMCYLRLAVNPDDNTAFLRVINTPRREIGAVSLGRIAAVAARLRCSLFEASLHADSLAALKPGPRQNLQHFTRVVIGTGDQGDRGEPLAAIKDMLEELSYRHWLRDQADTPVKAKRKLANIEDLLSWLKRIHDGSPSMSLTDLLGQLALMSSLEDEDPGNVVRLMTLHSAKGLEFPHVFIVGVEEGLLPHSQSLEEGGEQEERRLMYVGITRSRESLIITHARKRKRYGEVMRCQASRFLDELPEELVEWQGGSDRTDTPKTKESGRAHLSRMLEILGD
jgi:ATP-dependent DNA helicase Rep